MQAGSQGLKCLARISYSRLVMFCSASLLCSGGSRAPEGAGREGRDSSSSSRAKIGSRQIRPQV